MADTDGFRGVNINSCGIYYYISLRHSVRLSVCPYHFFSETVYLLALKIGTHVSHGGGQTTKLFWVWVVSN